MKTIPEGCEECETCNGKGEAIFSCCTGEVMKSDYDLCPTCYEHCGEEECQDCEGKGYVLIGTSLTSTAPDLQLKAEMIQDARREGE